MEFYPSNEMLREVNCNEIVRMAKENDKIVVLDADLMSSSGFGKFMEAFPERSINCGVQEANMVGIAGGLSIVGFKPIIHTFASFAGRRAVDQVFMAGVYNKQNIIIIASDPGVINGANGGTHMGFEDIGIMRSMPNITIIDLTDEVMLKSILPQIINTDGMYYVRLFRKTKTRIYDENVSFTLGKAHIAKDGDDLTLIAEGAAMVPEALKAAELLEAKGISTRVVDMFTIKPIDEEVIVQAAKETKAIITIENHNIHGGLGSAVAEVIAKNNCNVLFKSIGFPDTFGETGTIDYIIKKYGLDCETIAEASYQLLKKEESKLA